MDSLFNPQPEAKISPVRPVRSSLPVKTAPELSQAGARTIPNAASYYSYAPNRGLIIKVDRDGKRTIRPSTEKHYEKQTNVILGNDYVHSPYHP